MFTTRLVSGIVLVILAVLIVGTGGALLFAVTAALSLIGMFELYRVVEIEKKAPGIAGYAAGIFYYALLWFHRENYVVLMAIAALMILMAIYVITFPHYRTEQVTVAFFGIFYLAVMLSYLYQVRAMTDGKYLVWLIVLSSWGCDTCAYCVGMLFGKHKMSPKLSPKKSVEGAFGGVIGAALLTILYGFIFRGYMGEDIPYIFMMAGICAAGALLSMVGDLAASAIKRNYEIKDYGKLIPGHGGILDRFDSVIFTAPVIYFLSLYVICGNM